MKFKVGDKVVSVVKWSMSYGRVGVVKILKDYEDNYPYEVDFDGSDCEGDWWPMKEEELEFADEE